MAEKKMTQAQKTSAAKNSKSGNKKADSKLPESAKAVKREADGSSRIPTRFIGAAIALVLFALFLVIAMNQEGFILEVVENVVQGLIGKVAFFVSIPVLLYLFIILSFSGKQPVTLRLWCSIGCILITGCISHLVANPTNLGSGFDLISDLYVSGITGSTGGVICGLVTELLKAAFGKVFTYIVLIVGGVLCLLAVFRITIPSLIRAFRNRPRLEDEDDDVYKEEIEPAQVVVNTIANKRIAYVENRRRLEAERAARELEEAAENARLEAEKVRTRSTRTNDMIAQITGDIDTEVHEIPLVEGPRELIQDIPMVDSSAPVKKQEPVRVQPETVEVKAQVAVQPGPVPVAEEGTPVEIPAAPAPEQKKITKKETNQAAAEVAAEIEASAEEDKPVYCFPPISLLRKPRGAASDGTAEMRENTKRLNETLASFKIEAHISNVTRGPSVTRYEVELEKGVRLNKLTTAADDIALSLGASGVRIAPVPGKISVVGIEVPNQAVTTVSLREVIDSSEFARAKSKSSIAVGKDIGGSCIVGNIAKFPHMLIAGTTGSGKSVCMNSIIISLLYKASPEDVKLIMVDPKMVELGIYNGIPHLLIPVVTDPKKAAGSLQWAVTEMLRRYRSMSDAGVRDLESYNSMIDGGELEGEHLPQIVVIIDELADLMLVAAKEVEESICRIAQMGRAAGIHLIIATQRPSADVITGLMKANIPSRIAFSVASAMESRIILDTQGAEKLVGKGDMLFSPIGSGKPQRVQGCFVSDAEVEAVASYVKEHYATTYDQTVIEEINKQAEQTGKKGSAAISASDPEPNAEELDGDEMLPAAVEVILETKQASVSMLQRRLKLGYARAARIVDEMEEKGIVGPFVGSKPRQILITKEQWEMMKGGQTAIAEPAPEEAPPFDVDPVPEEI